MGPDWISLFVAGIAVLGTLLVLKVLAIGHLQEIATLERYREAASLRQHLSHRKAATKPADRE